MSHSSRSPLPPDVSGLPAHHEDHPEMISRNVRYGLILFSIYLVVYGGFVLLSAFAPRSMAASPLGGVNLAILYGMGLIFGAFLLAVIYMYLCRPIGGGGATGSGSAPSSPNSREGNE